MVPFQKYLGVFLLFGCAAVLSGCGNRNPATNVVSGVVAYHGKPVENAGVMFMPQYGRPASGRTDAQGRFELRTYQEGDGAVLGENVVCIVKKVPKPSGNAKNPMLMETISVLPERYASPATSPLKVTVSAAEPNDFRFDLTD